MRKEEGGRRKGEEGRMRKEGGGVGRALVPRPLFSGGRAGPNLATPHTVAPPPRPRQHPTAPPPPTCRLIEEKQRENRHVTTGTLG